MRIQRKEMGGEMLFGVDIGGSHIRVGRVVAERVVQRTEKAVGKSPDTVAQQIASTLAELGASGTVHLGIGCAGRICPQTGKVLFSPNLGWRDVDLAAEVERATQKTGLQLLVTMENDVNAAVWGEFRCGAGKGKRNIAAVFVGTGIGGGLVIEGKLVRGASGGGAEVGHAPFAAGGARCVCGRRGCFEAYAGGWAVEAHYEKMTGKRLKASEIWTRRREDPSAAKVWRQAIEALAHLLLTLSAIVDVEMVVLGGGIVERCEGLADEVASAYRDLVGDGWRAADVAVAKLTRDATLVGAALLAL